MKKIVIFLLLLLLAVSSFCQQPTTSPKLTKQGYLDKSKEQKKIAKILLASAGVLIVTSAVIPKGDLVYDGICVGALCTDKYKNDGVKTTLFIVGGLAGLGSIPLFISSKKNEKKGMSLSFIQENTLQNQGLVPKSFPALSLKISLE